MAKDKKHSGKSSNDEEYIRLRGVRVNNLKNINVDIPRNKFVVITGVSGSGKSSLAFDTLYAEGQRRYVESLSTYARQFLGRMNKPECDFIQGIPPAIAIEQKVIARNPRSTVGTSTEIYDYLRMLFARIGHTYSPISGQEVRKHSVDDILDVLNLYDESARLLLLTKVSVPEGRTLAQQLEIYSQEGFKRIIGADEKSIDSTLPTDIQLIDDVKNSTSLPSDLWLVVDRLTCRREQQNLDRLADSARTAMYEGDGACSVLVWDKEQKAHLHNFSMSFEADGIKFEEPSDQLFSFNSPAGACPECEGFGRVVGIDESLVIPDQGLSVYDGAVICWRGEKMGEWRKAFIRRAERHGFPIFTPYYDLTQEQKDQLWHGFGEHEEEACIDHFFDMLRQNQYKIQYRVMLARYRGKTTCPTCHGGRLRKEALYVKIQDTTITDLVRQPVSRLVEWFANLQLNEHDAKVGERLLKEIRNRLSVLDEVGLGYLTLDRLSNTLSGGESQRINLASSIGSSLVGSLYILDEPSIGLHPRDTHRLIRVLRRLQEQGNTVVVVEHDEDIMRAADYIIDIGPDAGRLGGQVVWHGTPSLPLRSVESGELPSHTLDYLLGSESIDVPSSRRAWNNYIEVIGARENNLKNINVRFPLNVMTVVTGVSGSGKSTLVRDILYRAMKRQFDEVCDSPGQHTGIQGDISQIHKVEFVDQNPIGTSTRSNPVTYIGAYDEIRKLMSQQQLSRQMNYTPAYFSFNQAGGRCEECKGEGTVTIEMQFMNDLVLECESCHGKRFKQDILDVKYEGVNIDDMLNMTVNQAVEFFTTHNQKKITSRLKPLQDVGLGYLKLGQSSSTLSGGESQRVKLAYYLSQEKTKPTLFIFDEPTTGLHFHDIKRLLKAFSALISRGHTVLIIEHNVDVMKCADHIIDLGPEGGDAGGQLVFTGTPEQLLGCKESHTARFIRL